MSTMSEVHARHREVIAYMEALDEEDLAREVGHLLTFLTSPWQIDAIERGLTRNEMAKLALHVRKSGRA